MMLTGAAALYRVQQAIAWNGNVYEFFRQGRNEYGEQDGKPQEVARIRGFFHNGSSNHVSVLVSDAGSVKTKETPYIMAEWRDAKQLELDDGVQINGNLYRVTGVFNVHELNLIGEISLEVVL